VDELESDGLSIEELDFHGVPVAALMKTSRESEATWKLQGLHVISMVVRVWGIKT